jgi:hypothetical protein
MMTFDFRTKMIDAMVKMGWGYSKPTPEAVESMRKYYEAMSDEDIFSEYTYDVHKAGQDSMSY